MKSIAFLAMALLSVGLLQTAAAQVETEVDVYPDWKRKPTASQLQAVWPTDAAKKQQTGKAIIVCKVNTQGALYECRVESETPVGSGFGAAAVALTPQFLMSPAMKGGKPVAYDGVRIPVNFSQPPPPPRPQDFAPQRVAGNVKWIAAPTYDEVLAAYPAKAREAKLGGTVSLTCTLTKDGHVKGCSTLMEEPKGYGFSAAARSLAPRFVGPTQWSDGKSVAGGRVDIGFTFLVGTLQDGPRLVGKPQWARVPTADQLIALLPKDTETAPTTVRVVLDCLVQPTGELGDCKVQSESPSGKGYGASALATAPYFQVTIWTVDGLPTAGARIKVPIRYELGAQPAKP